MKRLILAGTALLALAACSPSAFLNNGDSVTYNLAFRVSNAELQKELVTQSLRIMERRLETMGVSVDDKSVATGSGTAAITITAESAEALDALTADLTSPFMFAIMNETTGTGADITVEGHGGFNHSGIGNAELEWVQSREQPGGTKGEIRLIFTEAGRAKMADLFKNMQGKNIGLFVRDRLVSKLLVETNELQDDIVIRDVPDPAMAQVFADDVNVGINVTFTPVP